jgi:hypothetical protein
MMNSSTLSESVLNMSVSIAILQSGLSANRVTVDPVILKLMGWPDLGQRFLSIDEFFQNAQI